LPESAFVNTEKPLEKMPIRKKIMHKIAIFMLAFTGVSLVCSTDLIADDNIVASVLVPDIRPPSCVRNAAALSHCAKAWMHLVDERERPRDGPELWNAAEFQGFVDGLYEGGGTTGRRKWCPRTLESKDQLYHVIAEYIVNDSTQLDLDVDASEYTIKAMSKLWPCKAKH
jgi:hypothetical protein